VSRSKTLEDSLWRCTSDYRHFNVRLITHIHSFNSFSLWQAIIHSSVRTCCIHCVLYDRL